MKYMESVEVKFGQIKMREIQQLTPSQAKTDQADATDSVNTWTVSVRIHAQLFWSEIQMSKLQ